MFGPKDHKGGQDDDSPPYGIFGTQLSASLMTRQSDCGMNYTMFTKQYRMTGGIQELSSRLCYGGRLEFAESKLLTNRPQSQAAITFLNNKFGLATDVPYLCLNAHTGVCSKSKTMSRKNPRNAIIDMYIIEAVVEGLRLMYARRVDHPTWKIYPSQGH